jgi:hypothetical protein
MDFEAGYTTSIFDRSNDVRFKVNVYNYDIRQSIYGIRAGVDIMPWNGALDLRYEIGRDQLYGSYQTVGGFVNIPLDIEPPAKVTINGELVLSVGPSCCNL